MDFRTNCMWLIFKRFGACFYPENDRDMTFGKLVVRCSWASIARRVPFPASHLRNMYGSKKKKGHTAHTIKLKWTTLKCC